MGKIKCKCGHIIVDQTDNISYKGYILPDSKVLKVLNVFTESIDNLTDSIIQNKRDKWIKENFSDSYPKNLKNSDMIHDLIIDILVETTQDIFECENCGRIAIEYGNENKIIFFSPDNTDTKGIFNE
ncbi:hypothetical protein Q361_1301 [Flavobacterium croceum DSM 17960]|uniref:Uncharacterized protein n=1 Tax=Flavobacterium croceum DSM 17960 TaxID=1121886 RepID=A0A2S4N4M7_9FLAO|nr:hypothetical protein [Flavobacterium croceum]POS00688.1 hypothetical protein Q361_1301 [Flavobacterium croceum DSM 17960]